MAIDTLREPRVGRLDEEIGEIERRIGVWYRSNAHFASGVLSTAVVGDWAIPPVKSGRDHRRAGARKRGQVPLIHGAFRAHPLEWVVGLAERRPANVGAWPTRRRAERP